MDPFFVGLQFPVDDEMLDAAKSLISIAGTDFTVHQSVIWYNSEYESKPSSPTEWLIDGKENDDNFEPFEIGGRIILGSNRTSIEKHILDNIKWDNPSVAVRELMRHFFSKSELATHTLTGKPSPGSYSLI